LSHGANNLSHGNDAHSRFFAPRPQ
jgi:hypothetical protein